MKTKTLIALIVAASSLSLAFGNDNPQIAVVSLRGSAVFKVIYKGNTAGKVKLNIFDQAGRIIHSASIPGLNGFICPLNFKGLDPGTYTIELIDNLGSHRENVVYTPVNQMKVVHVSKLRGQAGKFLLAVARAHEETITIRIYEDGDKLVYSESKNVNGDFAEILKLEKPDRHYLFEISDTDGNTKHFAF